MEPYICSAAGRMRRARFFEATHAALHTAKDAFKDEQTVERCVALVRAYARHGRAAIRAVESTLSVAERADITFAGHRIAISCVLTIIASADEALRDGSACVGCVAEHVGSLDMTIAVLCRTILEWSRGRGLAAKLVASGQATPTAVVRTVHMRPSDLAGVTLPPAMD